MAHSVGELEQQQALVIAGVSVELRRSNGSVKGLQKG